MSNKMFLGFLSVYKLDSLNFPKPTCQLPFDIKPIGSAEKKQWFLYC